jgi:hypothetical protein
MLLDEIPTRGPWQCPECYGQACDVCRDGRVRCTICSKAPAVIICGPTDRACAECAALVRELEARWSEEDLAATVEDLQPVSMLALVTGEPQS